MRQGLSLLVCCAIFVGNPAQAAAQDAVSKAVGQPFRDLSLIQDKLPEVLKHAAESPYDLTTSVDCPQIRLEISELDAALGPDLDELGSKKGSAAGSMVSDLIGGVVKIPFRGILRRVSGAQKRDDAIRAATLAGMVRRGFLKGRLSQLACPAA